MLLSVEIQKWNNGTVAISISEELNNRKQKLYFSDKQIAKMQATFEHVLSKVINLQGFEGLSRGYYTIDWYENVNGYDIPVFSFNNGRKNYFMNTEYIVPKDWELVYSLRLLDVTTIRGINTFLSLFKIKLSDAEKEEVRKVIRDEIDGVSFQKIV